jgi:GTP pyrophosphokinase
LRQEKSNGKAEEISDAKTFESQIKKVRGVESDMLLIGEDMDRIDYILAKCCNPIPGDDVFGFVTVNEGIKIHRTSCPNAVELMSNYGYRIIKAKWTSQKEIAFLAGLRITGTDRVGLVSDLTKIISNELKVNMRSITIDTNDGIFEGYIMLFVHDTKHLDILMKKLSKVPGIVNVTRFDSQATA